jgi:hypothetical protein
MNWMNHLKGDSLAWLLEPENIGVRYLALRDLVNSGENSPELSNARAAAHQQGPITKILDNMHPQGYWEKPGPGYLPKYTSTVWAILLLAQLGASIEEDARIRTACDYLMEQTLIPSGQFTMSGSPSGTVDCLQGNLIWSLLELGCTDARLGKAIDWMARSVTGEGIAPMTEKNARERYYAGKCGPNFACGANDKQSCAWGAAKVMLALGMVPVEMRTTAIDRAIQKGIDFIFCVDPSTAAWPCGYAAKPSGNWWKFGFPVFYITDLLQVAEGLAQLGYGSDPRAANMMKMILDKQDEHGRWMLEYDYAGKTWGNYGVKKEPNKWVTLRVLRVLKKCSSG